MEPMRVSAGKKRTGDVAAPLKRLLERRPPQQQVVEERCEMCTRPIEEEHPHLVNLESRSLLCSCRPCALLFENRGAGAGKFRRVPDRFLYDPAFQISESDWDGLRIPVRMAFFFHNTSMGHVVAFYPSPAGATESTLELESWRALAEANPILGEIEPDVEALLVYGHRGGGFDCYVVPISTCYELTGVVRKRWKGFDGGEEAWSDIDGFFARIRERSREVKR